VFETLKPVSASRRSLPVYAEAEAELTCYVAPATAALAQELANQPDSGLAYVSPLPPMLKVAKSLLDLANDGKLVTPASADDTSADKGAEAEANPPAGSSLAPACGTTEIRVTLTPEAPGANERAGVEAWAERVRSSLTSGGYLAQLREHFFWVATERAAFSSADDSSKNLRKPQATTEGEEEAILGGPAAGDWQRWLTPVLDGTITCDFSKLEVSADHFPYATLSGACPFLDAASSPTPTDPNTGAATTASSCLLAAAALASLDPRTLHVIPAPRFVSTSMPTVENSDGANRDGLVITLGSGSNGSMPLMYNRFWSSGLFGMGQVFQVGPPEGSLSWSRVRVT
jgi:hypothetical protein